MTTPFDSVLKVVGREVDTMRSAVGVAAGLLAALELARDVGIISLRREAAVAAADRTIGTDAYFAAAAVRRDRIEIDCVVASDQLDRVRQAAITAYGSLRAVEAAAGRFRAADDLRLRGAEQSAIDDFIGARCARAARRPTSTGRAIGGLA